jgi:hypothetical protein
MPLMKSKPPTMDANETAARVVGETIARHSKPLPADLEAAWAEWSRAIQKVDERGMTLLRAAFEAGWEAGKSMTQKHSAPL